MAGRPSDNPALVLCWNVDRPRAVSFVSKEIVRTKGDLSAAAFALGVHRRTLHRWVLADASLAATLKAAREKE